MGPKGTHHLIELLNSGVSFGRESNCNCLVLLVFQLLCPDDILLTHLGACIVSYANFSQQFGWGIFNPKSVTFENTFYVTKYTSFNWKQELTSDDRLWELHTRNEQCQKKLLWPAADLGSYYSRFLCSRRYQYAGLLGTERKTDTRRSEPAYRCGFPLSCGKNVSSQSQSAKPSCLSVPQQLSTCKEKERARERATLWFVTSLEKIVVFPPSLKSCNCRSWIYGGSRANRTNYFISQCNTAIKVSATVVPHASLLRKKNRTHTCMHMHTHAHTCTKWQSLLQNACVWGRARYILPRRKSARNYHDCH